MTYVVGVDGGGTSTRAIVAASDGTELARAKDRGAVATSTRPEEAAEAVRSVVDAVVRAAGVEGRPAVLWAGLAGAGQEGARTGVTRLLEAEGLADRVIVGTDVEAAFHDAFGGGRGVLLIAGTGSIAWSRDEDGSVRRTGGWGHRLGDEGSGYSLGIEGLRAVLRAHDGRGPGTGLTRALLDACGVSTADGLVVWIETAAKGDVAALAPAVVAAADAGDEVAVAVVAAAVHALVEHVRAAAPAGPTDVVLWGGLVADGGPLEARVREAVAAAGFEVSDRRLDPVRGAALLAIEAAG